MPTQRNNFINIRPKVIEEFWNFPRDKELQRLVSRQRAGRPPRLSIYVSDDYGVGKTAAARSMGMTASCIQRVDGLACGECKPCKFVYENTYKWCCAFHELDGSQPDFEKDFRKAVYEDSNLDFLEMARIYERIKDFPTWGVVFIDEAHRMTPKQQEMLLKPVEDCTKLHFILATTNIEKRVAYAIADESVCIPRPCLDQLEELFSVSKNITEQVWEKLYGKPLPASGGQGLVGVW